ncbi:ABC transporter substrate-binding protein [Nisaea acidiphila]|uniref:ABC transporter substrate-binding protein n=1 Tax=Nisaea acidiphila TaxID=1862145 RepID=A0A9J7AV11_9PROT|nr:ABC transporter substrate-binding protein [Nisaea acidiphila]UUX50148.1 ABC transporter substrate-binding protein [Nisaea acidiphila]
MRLVRIFPAIAAGLLLLGGCGEPAPIKVGFVGGLEGRASDIGIASRNALQMAVDEVNGSGGIDGRMIELFARDDNGTAEGGAEASRSLVEEGVAAIIGPNLSVVASGMLPVINDAKVVTISPTVSSTAFVGKNDYFYRIGSSTTQYAEAYAEYCWNAGYKTVAAALDGRNAVFSESWLKEFRRAYENLGGKVVTAELFDASLGGEFSRIADILLASDPDALLYIANGVDTAQFSQQIVKRNSQVPSLAAEWAASEGLIELGGKAVEGLVVLQTYDRYDSTPRYTKFRDAYIDRFRSDPGFSSIAAYDGAEALFSALRAWDGEGDLKSEMDALPDVRGLQQTVDFDEFGDSRRKLVFVSVRDGKFVRQ